MASNSRFQWIKDLASGGKTPDKPLNCLNCNTEFQGFYCPQCGQKSKTRRLTIAAVIKDFMDALSDSDKGFLRTVIDLSKNPGSTLNDYIAGKRQRYLSAGKYSFFLVVLFTVNISFLEYHYGFFEKLVDGVDSMVTHFEDKEETKMGSHLSKAVNENPNAKEVTVNLKNNSEDKVKVKDKDGNIKAYGVLRGDEDDTVVFNFSWFGTEVNKEVTYKRALLFLKLLIPQYHRTIFDYLKFFIVLWIPIFAFFSFIFFFKSPFNFAEHITINAFIYSHLLLIMCLFSPLYWILPELASTTFTTSTLCAGFYLCYSYFDVYRYGKYRAVKVATSLFSASTTYLMTLLILACVQAIHFAVQNIDKM